ncbi:MAG: S9 family peptidase [Chloroflexota bacterium]|nr:S9 family peptidase [Chloroflexota bacterium]
MPPRRRRPITAEDLLGIAVVDDPRVAPNEQVVAFVVTTIDRGANEYRSAIWIVPLDGGEPIPFTSGERRDTTPRWSPDGERLAFLSDRGGDKAQLYVMPARGGEARRLTRQPDAVRDFAWSPDSKHLVFVARVRPRDAPATDDPTPPVVREIDRIKHKYDGQGLLVGHEHLFVVSADGGEARQITDGDWDDRQPAWSPDGRAIAFASNRTPERDTNDASQIWVVAATGGRPRLVSHGDDALTGPAWSPDGSRIACVGRAADGPAGANTRLWLLPAEGGAPICLTPAFDRSLGSDVLADLRGHAAHPVPAWTPDRARIRFLASDRGNVHLFEVDAAGGTGEPRRLIAGERQILSFSTVGDTIAFAATTPLDPGDVVVVNADRGDERRLTDLNRTLLDVLDLVAPEPLDAVGADGQPVQAWVLPGRGRGRRPAILEIHGGPHALYGNAFFHEFQLLAARGYSVIYANPRGSRGYGERFCSEIAGGWGDLDHRDLMAVMDAAVARRDVDADRLGVAGGSYGGYMTNWIVGHTDRFKAAVTMRCLSNFLSMYGTSDIGTWFCERELLGAPRDQFERYWRLSPIAYAERVATPILILHAEQDLRCPLEQAEQWFVTLRRLGKTAELLRFPEESHNLSRNGRPDRRLLRLERILAWFDRYLPER